jgi:hypothetical protein
MDKDAGPTRFPGPIDVFVRSDTNGYLGGVSGCWYDRRSRRTACGLMQRLAGTH